MDCCWEAGPSEFGAFRHLPRINSYTLEPQKPFIVRVSRPEDKKYADLITEEMASSAQARGTGIARRSPEYVSKKMEEGKAVIALSPEGEWVGFCYIEAWSHEKYVANSGLIVSPAYRGQGVAKAIKYKIFELSRQRYPHAKIFGLTTGLAVMKINSELGYEPVTYSELTDDEEFWKGCQSCVNFDILTAKERKNCLCTAMLYDPAEKARQEPVQQPSKAAAVKKPKRRQFAGNFRLYDRWIRYKRYILLKAVRRKENREPGAASGESVKKRFSLFHLF